MRRENEFLLNKREGWFLFPMIFSWMQQQHVNAPNFDRYLAPLHVNRIIKFVIFRKNFAKTCYYHQFNIMHAVLLPVFLIKGGGRPYIWPKIKWEPTNPPSPLPRGNFHSSFLPKVISVRQPLHLPPPDPHPCTRSHVESMSGTV